MHTPTLSALFLGTVLAAHIEGATVVDGSFGGVRIRKGDAYLCNVTRDGRVEKLTPRGAGPGADVRTLPAYFTIPEIAAEVTR